MSRPPQIVFGFDSLARAPIAAPVLTPLTPADELSKYGYRKGALPRWCACCTRTFDGAADAFNCKVCAKSQRREVDKICEDSGLEE